MVQCRRKADHSAFGTPSENSDFSVHFLTSVKDLFEHLLRDIDDADMLGLTIQNKVNQNDKIRRNKF